MQHRNLKVKARTIKAKQKQETKKIGQKKEGLTWMLALWLGIPEEREIRTEKAQDTCIEFLSCFSKIKQSSSMGSWAWRHDFLKDDEATERHEYALLREKDRLSPTSLATNIF